MNSQHTWSSQQSYSSDLNLNYASTDVDDIVNSVAGSATLDNFVHLTGNETVNGIKSFPDGIVANVTGSATSATNDGSGNVISTTYGKLGAANTWTGRQTYTDFAILYNSSKLPATKGQLPSENINPLRQYIGYGTNYDNAYFIHDTQINTDGLLFFRWTVFSIDHNDNAGMYLQIDPASQGFTRKLSVKASVLPHQTNAYNLGKSDLQWKSVYAQSYYYNGTPWGLDKINTWTDRNIYENDSITIRDNNVQDTTAPDSDVGKGIFEVWNKDNHYWGGLGYRWLANGNSELVISLSNWNSNTQGYWEYKIGVNKAFNDLYFIPPNNLVNLGTSSNKWKSFNGVNPGALSLPISSYVAIDTSNWDLTGATGQSYTPTVHGWLFISIQNIAGNYLSIVSGRGAISIDGTGAQGGLRAMLPVIANESVGITVKTGVIFAARFYPAQGNV